MNYKQITQELKQILEELKVASYNLRETTEEGRIENWIRNSIEYSMWYDSFKRKSNKLFSEYIVYGEGVYPMFVAGIDPAFENSNEFIINRIDEDGRMTTITKSRIII